MKNSFFSPPGWVKVVVWVVAILVTAMGPPGALFVALPVAVIYTIACVFIEVADKENVAETLVSYLKRTFAARDVKEIPTQGKVESFLENSPTMAYIKTMLEDIDHINSISDEYGIQYLYVQFKLASIRSESTMRLYTTPDEERIDFIESYSHIFESYDSDTAYLTEEQLQKNFASSLSYERDGYTAKNPEFQQYLQGLRPRHFRLEEEYVRSYSLSLPTLWKLYCNERDLIREVAVKAIVEYAKSKGYKVSKQYNSYKDEHNVPMSEYYITIYFRC